MNNIAFKVRHANFVEGQLCQYPLQVEQMVGQIKLFCS